MLPLVGVISLNLEAVVDLLYKHSNLDVGTVSNVKFKNQLNLYSVYIEWAFI
jgi:hypothetical protein